MRKYLLFCLPFIIINTLSAQEVLQVQQLQLNDMQYRPDVRTVKMYRSLSELDGPIIALNASEELTLAFDVLTDDIPDLEYTIIHCNKDWTPSQLNDYEYIDGFAENVMYNFEFARSTTKNYLRFTLNLPNDDVQFLKSGNYVVVVYNAEDPNDLYLSRRFYIYEPLAEIDLSDRRPVMPEYYRTHQELILEIATKNVKLRNVFQELSVNVMQNWRYDNAYYDLDPVFVKEDRLIYFTDGRLLFNGMKEYRNFDTRNLMLLHHEVQRVQGGEVYLFQDQLRVFENYNFIKDINGNFVNGMQDAVSPQLEADYLPTHFSLRTYNPYQGGSVYIIGALSNWQLLSEFKMEFDFETKSYQKSVLLKQGYYDYMYAYVRDDKKDWDTSIFEGDYWETENSYQVFVYFTDLSSRYDRLIGYRNYNCLTNQ